MAVVDPHLEAFEARRIPDESVLAFTLAEGASGGEGAAILTERRLCFCSAEEELSEVPVTRPVLRYRPVAGADRLTALFETDAGTLAFSVAAGDGEAALGNLLGNIRELRQAVDRLAQAGLDPHFVSPPAEPGGRGVSAIYQLMRLRELVNQGILNELEFGVHAAEMIDRFRRQGAASAA